MLWPVHTVYICVYGVYEKYIYIYLYICCLVIMFTMFVPGHCNWPKACPTIKRSGLGWQFYDCICPGWHPTLVLVNILRLHLTVFTIKLTSADWNCPCWHLVSIAFVFVDIGRLHLFTSTDWSCPSSATSCNQTVRSQSRQSEVKLQYILCNY